MSGFVRRDVGYREGDAEMLGYFCAPADETGLPGVVVVHGAHGLDDQVKASCERIAAEGYAVLAADLWGERQLLNDPAEIGPMLGRFAGDRKMWTARLAAAQTALSNQREVDAERIAMVGYCFGGASALEYLRSGGNIRAAISLHGGLDMVSDDWSQSTKGAEVLIATGSDDPMAKPDDLSRIEEGMSGAGVIWDTMIYGGVKHAFTEPDAPGRPPFAQYNARADRRSFAAMCTLLSDALA